MGGGGRRSRECQANKPVLQANILSLEEQIIDATTEEGQKQLKEMEKGEEADAEEDKYGDPE